MFYGTIVKFIPDKSFGFIRSDGRKDVFFHESAVIEEQCEQPLRAGQHVKYELMSRNELEREEERLGKRTDQLQARAKSVELIEQLPGGTLGADHGIREARHPKARRKKPSWRRSGPSSANDA